MPVASTAAAITMMSVLPPSFSWVSAEAVLLSTPTPAGVLVGCTTTARAAATRLVVGAAGVVVPGGLCELVGLGGVVDAGVCRTNMGRVGARVVFVAARLACCSDTVVALAVVVVLTSAAVVGLLFTAVLFLTVVLRATVVLPAAAQATTAGKFKV